jgi:hypothetical protein
VFRRISPVTQHHESHRKLVSQKFPGTDRRRMGLDAIIVPASRPAGNLCHAVDLARALNCRLVVFCSRKASAVEVRAVLASNRVRRGIAVDLPYSYEHKFFDFRSSKLIRKELPEVRESPNGDLSRKRNLGLMLARILGWKRIFFMDDDIRNVTVADLRATVAMLDCHRSAGMRVTDFPDNSVVCHAHREVGGTQDIFLSGSVLAVNCVEDVGFFPEIYNEDWLFFYDDARTQQLGWSGRNATQLPYDPFRQWQRAEREEFGDVLAEGLYALLDEGMELTAATENYWKTFLDVRQSFLDDINERSRQLALAQRIKIQGAIETAKLQLTWIQPSTCERYVKAWRADLDDWRGNLDSLPSALSVKSALAHLGLTPAESEHRDRFLSSVVAGVGRHIPSGPVGASAGPA